MHAHEELIQQLYACFSRKDFRGMAACYHPESEFSDGVFEVKGKQIGAMWHMLCASAPTLSVRCHHFSAGAVEGTADWEAIYVFSRTGRKVHNQLHAHFEFRDGKIIRHRDTFRFWRWARMALGTTGLLLGWTPFIRRRVRKAAAQNLKKFVEKNSQYQ